MKSLIKDVKLSKTEAVVGESVHIDVETRDPATEVTVNNVGGASHFLQFDKAGTRTIVVAATLGKKIEQAARKIRIRERAADVPAFPLIGSAMDRYRPRTVVFSLLNAAPELANVEIYEWDFGDGTRESTFETSISHDYTDALARDKLVTTFDAKVTARHRNGSVIEASRTIAVFCVYAYNKLCHRVLTPRVDVLDPISLPFIGMLCLFTVHNLEDEEISFTAEKHEWLTTDPGEPRGIATVVPGHVAHAAAKVVATKWSQIPIEHVATLAVDLRNTFPREPAMDVRVPPRSSVTMVRLFSPSDFKKPVFGVAVHLSGAGMCSKLPAVASAYIEVRLPLEWGGRVRNPKITDLLIAGVRAGLTADVNVRTTVASPKVTHEILRDFVHANTAPFDAEPVQASGSRRVDLSDHEGVPGPAFVRPTLNAIPTKIADSIAVLIAPHLIPFTDDEIVLGTECDPDNVPDDVPEGTVCQLTGETAWRFVPGRVLNGKKGDVVLSPGNQTLIAQLLRQVSPAQYYSHSGIMTKNHIELRHSTASPEWMRDHPKGGGLPTDGFEPAALKFLWPGTITQSIDDACYFQWLMSPDHGPYRIHSFDFEPDVGTSSTLVYPVVVKPSPFLETPQVRQTLHAIANEALQIKGHYRFFCYTNPAMALNPSSVAGPEAGWANGTLPTVCSSFIWLAAKRAGVRLEGPDTVTPVGDLEPIDTARGAEVNGTPDGLYHYTAEERQAAGRWLYQHIYDEAHSAAGFFGTLFTDAPDDIANQICNTFASDWADGDSKDSDAWQHTGAANAVSPDNLMFWDSPASGNQRQFRSVYGYIEELFYQPGTYQQVPIYRWKHVQTRGTLTGRVVANGDVGGANVSVLGSGKPDVVVGSDGTFTFDNIYTGDYTVSAGLNINGHWNSAAVAVHINAGATTDVTVMLQPPPEVNRLVTIDVSMETDWSSIWAHSPRPFFGTRSVRVHPFHSHERLEFEGSDDEHGKIIFDIDLNPNLSITVSWTAQEIDGGDVEAEVKGGWTIPQDGTLNWTGLRVVDDDFADENWTTMSFTIRNELANA